MFSRFRACLFLALFSMGAAAQDNVSNRLVAITVSPLWALMSTLDATVAVKVTNFMAITVPGRIGYLWPLAAIGATDPTPLIAKIGAGIKFMTAANGLDNSFFVEPRVTYDFMQLGVNRPGGYDFSFKGEFKTVTPTLLIGGDWYWNSGFAMGLGIGAGWSFDVGNKLDASHNGESASAKFSAATIPGFGPGLDWTLEWKMGYSF